MEDPTFIQDKIREMTEEVAELRKLHESEVLHVQKARNDHEQALEQLENSSASVALAEVSSRALVSTGIQVESRIDRDNRLLKHSTDTVEIAERVLELQILDREHDRSVRDAKDCASEWKERVSTAERNIERIRTELAAVLPSERGDLVSTMEEYTALQTKKRRLLSDMEDERRAHTEKVNTRVGQIENMQETLAKLDIKISRSQSDIRRIEREKHSYDARIESLEEQREEYRQRLQAYSGNDDLLRVSFKRYDTDMSGNLDAKEIYAATKEILAIK
jgi:chromosome segregation ATPase